MLGHKNDAKVREQKGHQVDTRSSHKIESEGVAPPVRGVVTSVDGSAIVDEAALIEARRKRREAIKNQYKAQTNSLLVQAHLGPGESLAPSTANSERSGNVKLLTNDGLLTGPASPPTALVSGSRTPHLGEDSTPQSSTSIGVVHHEGAADDMFGSPGPVESPSAADYDPTADMRNERARHDRRLFLEDEVSPGKVERQVHEQAAQKLGEPFLEREGSKGGFDMFADDVDGDDMFVEGPSRRAQPSSNSAQTLDANLMDNWDDHEGYYITILGELIDNRYKVSHNLGRGMFASVIRATDTKLDKPVAIKIVRNNESMKKAGSKEVEILKDLAANDPEDRKHVIRLLRSFEHKGHLCMVFENMSMNLREVLKKYGRDVGINLKAIRAYAQQLFLSLSLLRKCQYLHADLKPDNVLTNEARNIIKLADLGSASPITENATAPYLVSRFYRAPEVILGIEYDYGIDMWSTGCTLFELYTGKILFTGRNNNHMIRGIMECRGKFPHKLLRKGSLTYEYFDDLLNFKAQEVDKVTGRTVTKLIDVKARPVRDLKSRLMPTDKRLNEQERKELESFADLLDKCLDVRPDKRITPTDALKHPFITKTK